MISLPLIPNPNSKLRLALIDFANQAVTDDRLACIKEQWACQRFLYDLEREGTEEFPFIFEPAIIDQFGPGERFLEFTKMLKHSKGVLAGQYFEPAPIHQFLFGQFYGWINVHTGFRRFEKLLWLVGKKNSKTQSLAFLAANELLFGPKYGEIYSAATKRDQAKLIYSECCRVLENSPFRDLAKETCFQLTGTETGTIFKPLSQEDGRKGDGLNPSVILIDEIQAFDDAKILNTLASGQVARNEPILAIISTVGEVIGNSPALEIYDSLSKVLDPNMPGYQLEDYLILIQELDKGDDISDETLWPKANPIVMSYPRGRESLRSKYQESLINPIVREEFKIKNLNLWQRGSSAGFVDIEFYSNSVPLPPLTILQNVIVGLDLSATTDLTSVAFCSALQTGEFVLFTHSFMPEASFEKRCSTDNAPYEKWQKQGWITVTPGYEINHHTVLEHIQSLFMTSGWKPGLCCFDRRLAVYLRHELEAIDFQPVDLLQNFTNLSEATKQLRSKFMDQKIIHGGDPVLEWAISNTKMISDHSGGEMISKARSNGRIDPLAAAINAFHLANGHELAKQQEPKESIYVTRIREGRKPFIVL